MAHPGQRMQAPFWLRLWKAVRPPPAVPSQRRPLTRSQRRLVGGTVAALIPAAAGLAIFQYVASAEERADQAFQSGMHLMAPGRYPEAIAQFTRAVEIWPQDGQAFLQRANAHQVLNQTNDALSDYGLALDVDPNLATAYTARGIIYSMRGDLVKAVSEFDQSIRAQPTVDAYYQMGQVHYQLGEFQRAIDDYDKAIVIGRDTPYVYLARASAKIGVGDTGGAQQDRNTAKSLQTVHD